MYKGLIVIIDEIHRMNKDKQDILLPYLESGLITLIGLTTSNPYHAINPAIRSRCQLFELKELNIDNIKEGINKAINSGYLKNIILEDDARDYLALLSGTDLRYAYNLLEVAYYANDEHHITIDLIKKVNNKPNLFLDKNGDNYYNIISAFQKSIRGSDVNAALHYLARLIEAEDLTLL